MRRLAGTPFVSVVRARGTAPSRSPRSRRQWAGYGGLVLRGLRAPKPFASAPKKRRTSMRSSPPSTRTANIGCDAAGMNSFYRRTQQQPREGSGYQS
jgi:hypothetical protein